MHIPIKKSSYAIRQIYSIFVVCISLMVCFVSCNNKPSQKEIKEQITKLKSTPIAIPLDKMVFFGSQMDSISYFQQTKHLKLVMYYDSSSCTSCALKKVPSWDKTLERIKTYSNKIKAYFIFAPSDSKLKLFYIALKNRTYSTPIFVDTMGCFEYRNPNILSTPILHSFLLDDQNNVILVGDPTKNPRIEEMFWRIVKEKLGEPKDSVGR